ncbi:hypothetical protein DK419_13400 [Methylobacterium terrae]|uniref:Uncharacterized protein n=1 Tax=Methylobacterium terrae TaxID=2202827 RepID=A0A2U8WNZ9_9HYPH|nr:hypothetical protein [Methylobacterium terrae]AWN47190.1 hypothetical protein DK419_13400 [Methylobacterium terrae]
MTLHILAPRPSAQVFDFRTGRPIHPDSAAAFARFDRQRSAHADRLAAMVVEADNVLLAVAADLLKAEQMADATDAESCGIRRAIIRRAGEAIVRFRQPQLLAAAQVGSAS